MATTTVTAPWIMDAQSVTVDLDVNPDTGLSDTDAAQRLAEVGPNELAAVERVPAWRRFASQFADRLIIILLVAAAVALVVSREVKTPAVVLVVVLINATVGFVQERKAEAALDTLRNLMVPTARVRRNATVTELASTAVVPGDIVVLDAGDRVPADGRLVTSSKFEVDESTLTGESQPVDKSATAVPPATDGTVALADRATMVHANTTVTRGHAEMVVTATGMATQLGHIAGLLNTAGTGTTPLQRQLDGLARNLAWLSGGIVTVVAAIGLARGQDISDVLLTAVALAVATIPEGLPAVTALTLALGVSRMARRNAIIKRMASVETLGCTDVVCTDKTGTLTLNQMTAHQLVVGGAPHTVDGHGYDPVGTIEPGIESRGTEALVGLALCSDAVTERSDDGIWSVVGDPTEGAVVVLAAKGGVDVAAVRAAMPRLAVLPFDSTNKFMATAHRASSYAGGRSGEAGVVLYVKGAIDVLMARAIDAVSLDDMNQPIDDARQWLEAANNDMASAGMRVLALATRTFTDEQWEAATTRADDTNDTTRAGNTDGANGGDVRDDTDVVGDLVVDLTIEALIGIVDPPRPEARAAIAEAHGAGMKVRMITGDHAATAAAIATQLGMGRSGDDAGGLEVVTGAELDTMDDAELDRRVGDIDVYARVSPEHKLRLVSSLQRNGQVVAMTGDGVNDAPALKQADIGVAMGITGTEVSKEAATMVLADDNFATIVTAVGEGRAIYDNIVKFVRFQLSTTLGFAALFLLSAVLGIAGGKPFTAIAILWVNIIMDGPPAVSLGLDPAAPDVMGRQPRPLSERILTPNRWVTIALAAVVMAAGTLGVLMLAPGPEPSAGAATVAGTMAFTTFVLFQFFNILNARSDTISVFTASTLTNNRLWMSLAAVVALQVAVVHVSWFQNLFDTTSINATQWAVCIAVASSVLWIEEVRKLAVGRLSRAARP